MPGDTSAPYLSPGNPKNTSALSAEREEAAAQPASPNASASSDGNNKRKRTAGSSSSSRGVANLTPDQLAKKRANDREAQRAIRERTKNQIEAYERKIRDLEGQQPYQELQHVLRQKELVEAENADIKKRLSQVLALIQPILGAHGMFVVYEENCCFNFATNKFFFSIGFGTQASPFQPYLTNRPNSSSNQNASTPNSTVSHGTAVGPQWQTPNPPLIHVAVSPQNYSQTQQLAQQRHEMAHNLDMGPERLGLDFLLDGSQRIPKITNGLHGAETPPAGPPSMQMQREGERERDSPRHHRSNSVTSVGTSYSNANAASEISGHSAPIRNGPPTCPLDNILLDFLHERQKQAAEGVSEPKLVGPAYPSVSSLLNPARSLQSHPLSKVFTDILSTFPDLSTLPEKVAVLYIMFLIMRWQISPTQENYDRLPEWVAPRPSQLFTPHPPWIDHLPWPKMRDRLVRDYNPRDYLFDNFFIPFTTTLSLNWPYEATDTLLFKGEGSGDGGNGEEVVINPVFERHLRRLENWSLGEAFARTFPGLVNTFRLKGEGERRV